MVGYRGALGVADFTLKVRLGWPQCYLREICAIFLWRRRRHVGVFPGKPFKEDE